MKRTPIAGVILSAAAIFAPSLGSAQESDTSPVKDVAGILNYVPGNKAGYGCFRRLYDKEHLASHPGQNVTEIMILIANPADDDEQFMLTMQAGFRNLAQPVEASAGCSRDRDGKAALNCSFDSDGGFLVVRIRDGRSILADIPGSIRTWDPEAADSETMSRELPFGADDKSFRLDRTDLKNCLPLAYDDETRAEINR